MQNLFQYQLKMSEVSEKIKNKLVTIAELCTEFKKQIEDRSEDCFICAWNSESKEVKICDEHNNIIQNIENKAAKEYAEKRREEKIEKLKRRLNFNVEESKVPRKD